MSQIKQTSRERKMLWNVIYLEVAGYKLGSTNGIAGTRIIACNKAALHQTAS